MFLLKGPTQWRVLTSEVPLAISCGLNAPLHSTPQEQLSFSGKFLMDNLDKQTYQCAALTPTPCTLNPKPWTLDP